MNVVITGGAGFIGSNSARYYASKGNNVTVFDNLSRKGSKSNIKFLKKEFHKFITFIKGDVRTPSLRFIKALENADLVLHLAANAAVTTSVINPREDFEINVLGTFNILEILREIKQRTEKNPVFIFSSTNKVYGALEDIGIIEKDGKYCLKESNGINEKTNLDFHSPYGCSKGAGDQYVRDYYRIYGLNTVVLRQSCIYGERQWGGEDQGWVAWFIIANSLGKPITIFGDGKQARDLLWVDDLINAYEAARVNIEKAKGQVYNVGGGSENVLSINEALKMIEEISGKKINQKYSGWRPGDQKVCVLDNSKIKEELGWTPTINSKEGLKRLYSWVEKNKSEIEKIFN